LHAAAAVKFLALEPPKQPLPLVAKYLDRDYPQTLTAYPTDTAVEGAIGVHAAEAIEGPALELLEQSYALGARYLAPSDPQTLAYISMLAFEVADACRRGDMAGEAAAFAKLKHIIRPYSTHDILHWTQCICRYIEYYFIADRTPPYRDWSLRSPPDINFGVIDSKLPSVAKILMLGDWGTHMTDNVALLVQALRNFKPDIVMHLGDIYYSGTNFECQQNVLQVMNDLMPKHGMKRLPFFAIPGNHEYYSGGEGFFSMIDGINFGMAGYQQKASYFCLRSADGAWQFLGMDTGYNDRNPVKKEMGPGLQSSEIKWHRDKLENFKGTTIMLSHHPLFSANASLSGGATPYLNIHLNCAFKPYFDRIAAWFWGHEHNFVAFKDGQCGLRKGRLIGCSAYEERKSEDPYYNKFPDDIAYAPDMKYLDLSPYQEDAEAYYNHAMALLEVSPAKIDVRYFQFPSWGRDSTPKPMPELTLLLHETITPTPPPGASVTASL
jgi:hypothetical protein